MSRPKITAKNFKNEQILFQLDRDESGEPRVLGKSNLEVYLGREIDGSGEIPYAVKIIPIPNRDVDNGKFDNLMNQVANSISATAQITSDKYPEIKKHIMGCRACVYNSEFSAYMIEKLYSIPLYQTNQLFKTTSNFYSSCAIDPEHMYILYELIAGEDLEKLIFKRGGIDYKKYGHQLLYVLSLLHGISPPPSYLGPIVHLDIKPANIMIDESGNLKLIDTFGLCKIDNPSCKIYTGTLEYDGPEADGGRIKTAEEIAAVSAAETFAEKNSIRASFVAAAPKLSKEAASIDRQNRNKAADVFAAGMTLYEMITRKKSDHLGERPDGMTFRHFWERMIVENRELDLNFPGGVQQFKPLIQKMIRRDYNARVSAAEALAEFSELIKGGGRRTRRNKKSKQYVNGR